MRMLKAVLLLVCCVVNAGASDSDVESIGGEKDVEEVVIKGTIFCGTWPIQHQRIRGCMYAELEKKDLPRVLEMRPNLISACLSCQGSQCRLIKWPDGKMLTRFVCRRLFWTPKRAPSIFVDSEHGGPLRASFTYTISTAGRVEDIKLASNVSDIPRDELLELIEKGAERVRFEPLVVADEAYEIVDLNGRYIL